jgi:ESCRT-II complex subunit
MQKNEFADYVNTETKDSFFIYSIPLQSIAQALWNWADKNAKIGSVETLVDLREDSSSKGEIFYMIDIRIIEKACMKL